MSGKRHDEEMKSKTKPGDRKGKTKKHSNEGVEQDFAELSVHKMVFTQEYSSFYSQITPFNTSLTNNDLIQVEKAWIAEKGSPHLLPFQSEAIASIISAIRDQASLALTKE